MSVGTILTIYDTKWSPELFPELRQTETQLTSTIGMLTVPADTRVSKHYILQAGLIAEVKVEDDKYVVIDYQVNEYGIGDSLQEAQQDLLDSLVDYLTSLERREKRLGENEKHNLQVLRSILTK